ncbi:MAG: TolC family protein [Polaromonas sp.]|uniref:TolC family protein n=1 Tax=Polaromonas sp. TaxID=1869339 RepID=UPI0025FA27DF|nr:TolC family protein [Polaromonas sp.]MBI2724791.1 TolC family protein [Polaromonas sp.]
MKRPGVRLTGIAGLMAMAFAPCGFSVHAQTPVDAAIPLRMDTSLNLLTRAPSIVLPGTSAATSPGAGQGDPLPLSINIQEPGSTSCRDLSPAMLKRLTLMDTVQYVMCKTPLYNQAVLLVDEQQAGVDLARSAYRPRMSANAELATNRIPLSNSGSGSLSASGTGSLGVSWVLFDSGVRDANLEQSRQTLSSARAAQQNAALNAINEALRLYVEAAAALSRLEALRETEAVARQSVQVAQAKYDAQVASLSEKLQTQTALAQAVLDRVRGEGVWETARGALAVGMGFPVAVDLELAPLSEAFPAGGGRRFDAAWMESTRLDHPRLRGARADVLALKSRLDSVRAEDGVSVSLALGAGSTRDFSVRNGRADNSVSGSVVASIPLFNKVEQQAREGQILAQIGSREEAIIQAEREVESELWRNIKLLETEGQNLEAATVLLSSANQSYRITLGRYKAGVGSILELIATQVALAGARSQLAQARISQAQARLRLEVAAGRIVLSK